MAEETPKKTAETSAERTARIMSAPGLFDNPAPRTATSYSTSWNPIGQTTQLYGVPEYQSALIDWQKIYGEYLSRMNDIKQPESYGGYGAGQRQEAAENVQGGVAQDLGSMVASGMSSQFGARGVGTRAGSELSKLTKNVEDTRMQLAAQSQQAYNQVYAQMMAAMANMQQSRPTYGQYVQPVTTTKYGSSTTGTPYTY